MQFVIAYDLGTGGLKTGLYQLDGAQVAFDFQTYPTYFPHPGWHEQHPIDWWQAVCAATKNLLGKTGIDPSMITAIAASGHSLVVAPIGLTGDLLLESVPIWSDRRSKTEAADFFQRIDYSDWYMTTGNGDPPETYSVFKLMWMKKHLPEIYSKTKVVLGSKDYINFKLTGKYSTDFSYASGSGVFDLANWCYREDFIAAAGLSLELFPKPIESHELVGTVTPEAAKECGLQEGISVFCGGVDNACMALGTTGLGNGRVYTSLGSSAWIAISSEKPIVDRQKLPFVFCHVQKGYYTTGTSIFSAGSSYRWANDVFCADFAGEDQYALMDTLAAASPVGANGVMFNPSLAGGSSQEPAESLEGGFFGLKLSSTTSDILRAILEGVALSLDCYCLRVLEPMTDSNELMILCGGGANSDLWMQIFADVYGRKVVITNVDANAATLGAAAIALRGLGIWSDYRPLDALFIVRKTFSPNPEDHRRYIEVEKLFSHWVNSLAVIHANSTIIGRMES